MNEIGIGHNKPDMAATAGETADDLSRWMAEHPAIQTEEEAKEAKTLIDRGSLGLKDLEDERKGRIRPLADQVDTINNIYRGPRQVLEAVVYALKNRVTNFLRSEEAKRERIAEEAARRAKESEENARRMEQAERDAYLEADHGVLGVDVASATKNADEAFAAYQKADRQAQIAERDSHVKLAGGFTRAISLRERETLVVTNGIAAIKVLGITDGITEAIIKDARAYRRMRGDLPPGVESVKERKV